MGTSNSQTKFLRGDGDHPHAYGDKASYCHKPKSELGSSPRVWGQVGWILKKSDYIGIIPTRMGTRTSSGSFYPLGADHPHAYGDKNRNNGYAN